MLSPFPEVPHFLFDMRVGTLHLAEVEKSNGKINKFILKVLPSLDQMTPLHDDFNWHDYIGSSIITGNAPTELEPMINKISELPCCHRSNSGEIAFDLGSAEDAEVKILFNILTALWVHQPVSFFSFISGVQDGVEQPDTFLPGIIFSGFIRFDVWQIKESKRTFELKKVLSEVSYATNGEEFKYIKPISLEWVINNEEMLTKLTGLINKEPQTIETNNYLDKRLKYFGY